MGGLAEHACWRAEHRQHAWKFPVFPISFSRSGSPSLVGGSPRAAQIGGRAPETRRLPPIFQPSGYRAADRPLLAHHLQPRGVFRCSGVGRSTRHTSR